MKPLKFKPLLKSKIWGGDKIIPFKHLNVKQEHVGESWEVSGVAGNESVVDGGEYDGMTLNAVVAREKDALLGNENYKRYGNEFPLLVKFIDACDQLSIQVHPSDEQARKLGFERGKNEMWYIMESDPNAKLRCGLKKELQPEEYKRMVADGSIVDAIAEYDVKEGDCFFIPAGRIHSIGKGCFLAEIQQTSDVTFRIYDFKRKDKDGNYRELHVKEAAESIDWRVSDNYRTTYTPAKNRGVELVRCNYFNTNVYDLDKPMTLDYAALNSFVVLIGLQGEARMSDNEGTSFSLRAGESVIIPATTTSLHVEGTLKFLETYI